MDELDRARERLAMVTRATRAMTAFIADDLGLDYLELAESVMKYVRAQTPDLAQHPELAALIESIAVRPGGES